MTDEQSGARRDGAAAGEDGGLPRQATVLVPFTAADAGRLAELDRSESVPMVYAVRGREIVPLGYGEAVPQWSGAWLEHTIAFTRRHLEAGGVGWAAEIRSRAGEPRQRPAEPSGRPADEGRPARTPGLAGVAVLAGSPVGGDAGLLQLAFLHVGRPYRRAGLAGVLFARACDEAALRGACRLYISATPFEGALRFYLSRGARLADPPDPGLLELEPEDVHLVLDL